MEDESIAPAKVWLVVLIGGLLIGLLLLEWMSILVAMLSQAEYQHFN